MREKEGEEMGKALNKHEFRKVQMNDELTNDLVNNGAEKDPLVAISRKDFDRLVKYSTYSKATLAKIKPVPASWVFACGATAETKEGLDAYLEDFVPNMWPNTDKQMDAVAFGYKELGLKLHLVQQALDFKNELNRQLSEVNMELLDMEETRKKNTRALVLVACVVSFTLGALAAHFHLIN